MVQWLYMHLKGILNLFHLPFTLTLYQLVDLLLLEKRSQVLRPAWGNAQVPEDVLKLAVSEHSPGSPSMALTSALKNCVPA